MTRYFFVSCFSLSLNSPSFPWFRNVSLISFVQQFSLPSLPLQNLANLFQFPFHFPIFRNPSPRQVHREFLVFRTYKNDLRRQSVDHRNLSLDFYVNANYIKKFFYQTDNIPNGQTSPPIRARSKKSTLIYANDIKAFSKSTCASESATVLRVLNPTSLYIYIRNAVRVNLYKYIYTHARGSLRAAAS